MTLYAVSHLHMIHRRASGWKWVLSQVWRPAHHTRDTPVFFLPWTPALSKQVSDFIILLAQFLHFDPTLHSRSLETHCPHFLTKQLENIVVFVSGCKQLVYLIVWPYFKSSFYLFISPRLSMRHFHACFHNQCASWCLFCFLCPRWAVYCITPYIWSCVWSSEHSHCKRTAPEFTCKQIQTHIFRRTRVRMSFHTSPNRVDYLWKWTLVCLKQTKQLWCEGNLRSFTALLWCCDADL